MKETKYIWINGKHIPWAEATTHVLTHALHYGTGVFEGIRCYNTTKGPAIFRGPEHYERLLNSANIYMMPTKYSVKELMSATKKLILENEINSCYIRPLIYRGYGVMGLNPEKAPIETLIATWEWGTYLGEEGLEKGIRCKVSSWRRIDSHTLPAMAKCTANYANSVLAKEEAVSCGFDEALMLNTNGMVAEGPGENIFVVKDGKLITPPASDSVLLGITALSIIEIAKDMGFKVSTKSITREELFTADELFFTGTAAEVTPIREIDGRIIASKGRGPITEKLQNKFFEVIKGKDPNYFKWLAFVKE
jgi:branched-chain amino acid aminotransferase